MADFNLVITDAGRAALVNAAGNGTLPIIISHRGVSASAIVPAPAAAALPGEIKRLATIAGDVVAPDTIHVMVRDESSDIYTLRSLALYLADGTLFAIHGQAAPIMEKSAGAMLLMALDAQFTDINATHLSFGDTNFLNPPATTERQGVVELASVGEAQTGTDPNRAITPATGKQALLSWLLAQDGSGSGIDADLLDGQHATDFLQAALFTGAQILSRLLNVDGSGTGLDADLLDGQHASAFLQASQFTNAQILAMLLMVDGAGTGLDADLLDGQQGSYYADIIARLGFSPLNAALFTNAQILAMLLAVDGAGSGVDADLLDGQQGSWYADIAARLGFTPANRAGDTFTGAIRRDIRFYLDLLAANPVINFDTNDYLRYDRTSDDLGIAIGGAVQRIFHMGNDGAGSGLDADLLDGQHASSFLQSSQFNGAQILSLLLGVDGAGSGVDADLLDGQQGSYYTNIIDRLGFTPLNSTAYTAADVLAKILTLDGSGSGLDADTVDGLQASQFLRITAANFALDGYVAFSNGLKVQWGRAWVNRDNYTTITYPLAHTGYSSPVISTPHDVGNTTGQDNGAAVVEVNLTNFKVWSPQSQASYGWWNSIGY